MNLKKYDTTNTVNTRKGNPSMGCNSKGLIAINQAFAKAVGLKAGTKVSFAQDEARPEDWYLIAGDPDGFTLRENGNKPFYINNAAIVDQMADSLDALGRSFSCLLAAEPADIPKASLPKGAKAYAILTASIKRK